MNPEPSSSSVIRGAIDIGTNSLRLVVAEVADGRLGRVLFEALEVPRLGEGLSKTIKLSKEAQSRTLAAAEKLLTAAHQHGASEVRAMGTHALRFALNGAPFALTLTESLGISCSIISGEEEAHLVSLAVEGTLPDLPEPTYLTDIGGGSVEVIALSGVRGGARWSFPIGAVSMTEEHQTDGLSTAETLENIERRMEGILNGMDIEPPDTLVAVGGTVTAAAMLVQGLQEYREEPLHGFHLSERELRRDQRLLASLSNQERQQIPGLGPGRADVLVAGIGLVLGVMAWCKVPEVVVSTRGVVFGFLLSDWKKLPTETGGYL